MLLSRLLYNVSTFNCRFRPFLFLLFVEFLGHTEEILNMSSRLPCFNIVERVDVEILHFNSGLFPFLKQYDTISRVASWISGHFLKILFVTFVFFVANQNTGKPFYSLWPRHLKRVLEMYILQNSTKAVRKLYKSYIFSWIVPTWTT